MAFDPDAILTGLSKLKPFVDAHVTPERVRRYLSALADTPAPSTAASALRTPVLRRLLQEDGALAMPGLRLHEDYENTGSTVIVTGGSGAPAPLWYFAHLDTISYLVQPRSEGRHPLVPFCYHLIGDGTRLAQAMRYDLEAGRYGIVGDGRLESEAGRPFFRADDPAVVLRPGDRVVPVTSYSEDRGTGELTAHVDNAGGVAALAVAAPVLAAAGVNALLAFPDEEEGPQGTGSQVMSRGASRIISLLPAPDLAIVVDMQQAGGGPDADLQGAVRNATRLGQGAVLAEFASLARGAVTPPHLYALARASLAGLANAGVKMQESNNAYTSRSDDVSILLKTPNILLLGFPGFNRHFDRGEPRANLNDIVDLAKALGYFAAIQPLYRGLRSRMIGDGR